jgi:hypothetical protein
LISVKGTGWILIQRVPHAWQRRLIWLKDSTVGVRSIHAFAVGQRRRAVEQHAAVPNLRCEAMQVEPSQTDLRESAEEPTLTIPPEKVCFIIIKAREFDAKDEVTEPDPGSNPSDDKDAAVLEDHEDDPVVEELTSLINSLSVDEQIDLVALAWLGRDDYSASDWSTVRGEVARALNERTASYLLGTPLLGDFLEEGLSMLGYSCAEFETERL